MEESAARHSHLCPRQVLGIRMGLYGLQMMGLIDAQYEPRFRNERKHLLTIVEIDGCGADGLAIAICHANHMHVKTLGIATKVRGGRWR